MKRPVNAGKEVLDGPSRLLSRSNLNPVVKGPKVPLGKVVV